eukprot:jgi/Mesen1/9053/ME000057S08470
MAQKYAEASMSTEQPDRASSPKDPAAEEEQAEDFAGVAEALSELEAHSQLRNAFEKRIRNAVPSSQRLTATVAQIQRGPSQAPDGSGSNPLSRQTSRRSDASTTSKERTVRDWVDNAAALSIMEEKERAWAAREGRVAAPATSSSGSLRNDDGHLARWESSSGLAYSDEQQQQQQQPQHREEQQQGEGEGEQHRRQERQRGFVGPRGAEQGAECSSEGSELSDGGRPADLIPLQDSMSDADAYDAPLADEDYDDGKQQQQQQLVMGARPLHPHQLAMQQKSAKGSCETELTLQQRVELLERRVSSLLEEQQLQRHYGSAVVVPQGYVVVALPGVDAVRHLAVELVHSVRAQLIGCIKGVWVLSCLSPVIYQVERVTCAILERVPVPSCSTCKHAFILG